MYIYIYICIYVHEYIYTRTQVLSVSPCLHFSIPVSPCLYAPLSVILSSHPPVFFFPLCLCVSISRFLTLSLSLSLSLFLSVHRPTEAKTKRASTQHVSHLLKLQLSDVMYIEQWLRDLTLRDQISYR